MPRKKAPADIHAAAVALGSKGGKAKAKKLTPADRRALGERLAQARKQIPPEEPHANSQGRSCGTRTKTSAAKTWHEVIVGIRPCALAGAGATDRGDQGFSIERLNLAGNSVPAQ
jgi:hypothetical protein